MLTSPQGSTRAGRTEDDGGMDPLEDSLDRHVDDVLRRPSKLRRTMLGVWSFLKTRQSLVIFHVLCTEATIVAMGVSSFPFFRTGASTQIK